jgi:hypothetical protein
MQYGEIDPSRARSEGLEGDGMASGSMGGKKTKGRNGRRKQIQQRDEVEKGGLSCAGNRRNRINMRGKESGKEVEIQMKRDDLKRQVENCSHG